MPQPPNRNNNDNNNKNFFNDNPLLAFAIFSIVIILIFKAMIGDGQGMGTMINPKGVVLTKQVKYSDVKDAIKEGKVASVRITPTTIEAIEGTDGQKVRLVAQKVPMIDNELIPLLEQKKIPYDGVMGNGYISEIISMLLPILLFCAIWIFLAKRMSKGMGGVLSAGRADKLINSEKPNVTFDDV